MENYKNKIAVVTGASSGIGAGLAKELAKRGCVVIGLARRLDQLQLVSEEIHQFSSTKVFHPLQCDVSDEQQLQEAFTKIEQNYGIPSILINNAGVSFMKKFKDLNPQNFDAVIQTNVKALLFATKRVIEMMTKNSVPGHILNISSIAAHYMPPREHFLVYSASKIMARFVTEMIKRIVDQEKLNIKISNISPGVVKTPFVRTNVYDSVFQSLSVNDIVKACLFILDTPPNILVSELIITPVHQFTPINYPLKGTNKIIRETKAKL